MLIDFHTHLFPDAIAQKALGRLSPVCGVTPVTDGTVTNTLQRLREWQVDKAVVMHIATSPKQQKNVNDFAASLTGGILCSFGSVHPDSPDALEELDRIASLGLRGIKLHPDYQGFDVEDKRLYPIYERIRALGLCCCFHAGYDPLSPEHIHATPAGLGTVLRDFPGLKMICAHMGGMRLWDEVERHLVGRDVWLDTAFTAGAMPPETAARIISRHGAEHILFGSDCPWQESAVTFRFYDALPITEAQKDRIYYKNALELLGEGRSK